MTIQSNLCASTTLLDPKIVVVVHRWSLYRLQRYHHIMNVENGAQKLCRRRPVVANRRWSLTQVWFELFKWENSNKKQKQKWEYYSKDSVHIFLECIIIILKRYILLLQKHIFQLFYNVKIKLFHSDESAGQDCSCQTQRSIDDWPKYSSSTRIWNQSLHQRPHTFFQGCEGLKHTICLKVV